MGKLKLGTDIKKSKLIDVKAKEKLSFADKLQIFLNKLNKVIKNFQEERAKKNLERLNRIEKQTRLEAKIAKNQAAKAKVENKKKSNEIDWLKL